MTRDTLIEVKDLRVQFAGRGGQPLRALDGVSFSIQRERTLGVVGESGCGKSVTALSIMGLLPPTGRVAAGEILFRRDGEALDLARLPRTGRTIRSIRGNQIAMIFQEPMTSLNPVYTIANQIVEAIALHQRLPQAEARQKAAAMLKTVGIPSAEQRLDDYPHQLSGGMRQRVMIAMALSCNPALLIADEPTTALDVTVQAQVLELMNTLRAEYRTAIMFITHDLGVIAEMADDVIVMYLGRVVESGPTRRILDAPRHPYTRGLIGSIPSLTRSRKEPLVPIQGSVPDLSEVPSGCGFRTRCPHAMEICGQRVPTLRGVGEGQAAACWLYPEGAP
jgi:oligopeptide/dipeptide ABC transporter ATP-binding protein